MSMRRSTRYLRHGETGNTQQHDLHGGAAIARETVQRRVERDVMTHVGNVNAHLVAPVHLAQRTRVVDVHTPRRVDRHHIVCGADVEAALQVALFLTLAQQAHLGWRVHAVDVLQHTTLHVLNRLQHPRRDRRHVRLQLQLTPSPSLTPAS